MCVLVHLILSQILNRLSRLNSLRYGYSGDILKMNDVLSLVPKFQARGIAGSGYQVSVWMCKAYNCSTLSGMEIS